ncbi:MAG TPA: hypothetical protein GX530_01960 [Corynebacteriales bacterium]|nr:hypothetical protein [Mycobacteriales bacterium]
MTSFLRRRDPQKRRRWATLATVFTTVAALTVGTGCTVLPSDSPPQSLGQFKRTPMTFTPPKPIAGRSPDLTLRDYLRASAVPTNRHAAARLFLTPRANREWKDKDIINIVDRIDVNTVANPSEDEAILQVRARSVGEVDERGTFRSKLSTDTFEVELQRIDKKWLINDVPDEVLVERDAFLNTYESQSLYYLDTSGSRVVPDPRWLYSYDSSLPNILMQLLADEPSEQLHDAVASELKSSARISAVPGARGNGVDVEITNYTLGSEASRRRLAAQIVFTFERARVHGPYYITVNGEPLDSNFRQGWSVADVRQFDPMYESDKDPVSLHAVTAEGLMKVGATLTPVKGDLGKMADIRQASFSRGGSMIAAIVNTGERRKDPQVLRMGPAGRTTTVALRGNNFRRPSWAPNGRDVWVVDGKNKVSIVTWQDGEKPLVAKVDTSELGSKVQFEALRVSPDGVRVAYISSGKVYTSVIVRKRDGGVKLSNPQRIYISQAEVMLSLAWRSPNQILLGGTLTDRPVLMVSLDGAFSTPLGTRNVSAPVSVVVGNKTGIYVQDSRDVMRLEQGAEGYWQDVPALVNSPRAVPVLEG